MSYPIAVLSPKDTIFPSMLREIQSVPQQLYIRGNVQALAQSPLLAVVGSRKANQYGKDCIDMLLPPVVKAGISLVSGLAYGIDSFAHQVCVDAGIPTIAVLGSAIDDDSIYPRAHVKLAHDILETGGVLISEYPTGSAIQQHNFPARNRIIAGLATATLLIQASDRSGSLITARLALESGRDVLATPGPITDPLSYGTNKLIQEGATPVTTSEDILYVLNTESTKRSTPTQKELFAVT